MAMMNATGQKAALRIMLPSLGFFNVRQKLNTPRPRLNIPRGGHRGLSNVYLSNIVSNLSRGEKEGRGGRMAFGADASASKGLLSKLQFRSLV